MFLNMYASIYSYFTVLKCINIFWILVLYSNIYVNVITFILFQNYLMSEKRE